MFLSWGIYSQNLDSLYKCYLSKNSLKEKTTLLIEYSEALIKHDIDSAYSTSKIALVNASKLKDANLIADANFRIGFCVQAKGNYKEALQYLLKAAELYQQQGNKTKLSKCYTAMGVVYWYQGFLEKAIDYYKKNISLSLEMNDQAGLAASYGNIAILFDDKGDLDNALLYYKKALTIFEKVNDQSQVAACIDNMSLVYQKKEEYQTALEYNSKGYKIRESIQDTIGMLASMENLGGIFIKINKIDEAIEISHKVLAIASRIGAKEDVKYAYFNIKEAYEAKNDFKNANAIMNKLMEIKDSLRNEENANQIAELEAKFKNKEKEKEISEIRLFQVLKEKENAEALKRKNYFIIIISFIGLLVLSLAFLLLKRFKEKKHIAEEFSAKNQAIEMQKSIIDKAFHELSEKSKDITDSIKYAKRIQKAIFPSAQQFAKLLPQSFVFFKPKDIVSGDFYWVERADEDSVYVAVVDCTGHGVPGAFMSIVGFNLLNNAIHEHKCNTPADILNQVNKDLNETLKQTIEESAIKDGMEVSLCKWNQKTNELIFAGANTIIYKITNGVFETIKGDKHPIGNFYGEKLKPFTNIHMQLTAGDCLYLFSDGYADQFGGEKGKKYKYKKLEEFLLSNHSKNASEQRISLSAEFTSWKGKLEQVDDVTIIGYKVS